MRRFSLHHQCRCLALILFAGSVLLHAQSLLIEDMKSSSVTCDYLVICPEIFVSQALSLCAHRNGYEFDDVEYARAVSMDKIRQQFPVDDTLPVSFSIWETLHFACANWTIKPEYVVLLGDDSVQVQVPGVPMADPPVSVGLVPSFYERADTIMTLPVYFDYFFQTVKADSPPVQKMGNRWWVGGEMRDAKAAFALGRIPARSIEECARYIEKLADYETQRADGAWMNRAVITADNAYNSGTIDPLWPLHLTNSEALAGRVFKGFFVDKIYLSSYTKNASGFHENAKYAFFNAVNQGARLAVYTGHGSINLISEFFLVHSDDSLFKNDAMPLIFFSFSCLNGYFVRNSLYVNEPRALMNRSFLFKPKGGCIAYFAATKASSSPENQQLAIEILKQSGESFPAVSLGKAVARADSVIRDYNRYYFALLGDPAVCFRKKQIPLATSLSLMPDRSVVFTTTGNASQHLYQYRIAVQDSVRCADDTTKSYINDSLVNEAHGTVSGPITVNIPWSLKDKRVHYCLYVWNNESEARFDTVITPSAIVPVIARASVKPAGLPVFSARPGVCVISIPVSVSSPLIKVSLITMKGDLIRAIDLPCNNRQALLDYSRYGIARGVYLMRIIAGKYSFSSKMYLVK